MSDDLARLRRGCLDTAAGLAARRADAWADAGRLGAAIADSIVGVPLTPEHIAAGDALVDALMRSSRRDVVERLIDCARTLAGSAHERLEVEGRASAILDRLAADMQRPADPPPRLRSLYERRAADKQASRDADAAAVAAGVKTPADLARENHALARGGGFVRRPDGRPVIASIGGRPLREAS